MGTNAVPFLRPRRGTGYNRLDNDFVHAEEIDLAGSAVNPSTFAAGVTVGSVYDVGGAHTLRLTCAVVAKSGSNPTLDVTIQTSKDGVNDWRTVGTFAQKTSSAAQPNDGLVMGAVTSGGTTPPTITLTSTAQVQPVKLSIQCTDISTNGAARGQWLGQYSVDGGVTWVQFTSGATVAVLDPNGTDTGVVINIATGNAATDNTWTASTVGYERKDFTGLDKYVRAVANQGGSSNPTMTGYVAGRAVYF
jgi:hypothetical protein